MVLKPVYAELLASRIIPNADASLASNLELKPSHRSLAMFTVTLDDVGITALDVATKQANVEVAYAGSFYAGSDHASGPLSGEFIGILSGSDPEEVKSGLETIKRVVTEDVYFEALNYDESHCFYAQVIPSTGSYLSGEAAIEQGEPLAYLIAPPLEAMYGLDAALKAADVRMTVFHGPPTETNFGGGLLTGTEAACRAAAEAFRNTVIEVARKPNQC